MCTLRAPAKRKLPAKNASPRGTIQPRPIPGITASTNSTTAISRNTVERISLASFLAGVTVPTSELGGPEA